MSEDAESGRARRAAFTAQIEAETGIDEAMIEQLVRGFYARVREDALLGPVFASRIADWEPHLQRMCAFWHSVALMSGRYRGQPMALHRVLPIEGQHFERWLALFATTAGELCPAPAAAHFIALSQRIGRSLEAGVSREGLVSGQQ
jgi:hemoglobin